MPVDHYYSRSLWQFSLDFYGQNKVKDLCLKMQNDHGASVLVILWCCWLKSEGIRISHKAFVASLAHIQVHIDASVVKLQSVRAYVTSAQVFDGDSSKRLVAALLDTELQIEKILLDKMEAATFPALACQGIVEAPLDSYFKHLTIADAQLLSAQFISMLNER